MTKLVHKKQKIINQHTKMSYKHVIDIENNQWPQPSVLDSEGFAMAVDDY